MSTVTYEYRIRTPYATAAAFAAANPTLLEGEPAYESDTGKEKIGDGVTPWADLPYKPSSGGGIIAGSDAAQLGSGAAAPETVLTANGVGGTTWAGVLESLQSLTLLFENSLI